MQFFRQRKHFRFIRIDLFFDDRSQLNVNLIRQRAKGIYRQFIVGNECIFNEISARELIKIGAWFNGVVNRMQYMRCCGNASTS